VNERGRERCVMGSQENGFFDFVYNVTFLVPVALCGLQIRIVVSGDAP
jgi:hypothetical protein